MVLGKRGQVTFYLLMLAIVVIVLALALAYPVKQVVDEARAPSTNNSVGLDCGNSSISDYQKGQCVLTDLATPYFVFGLLGLAGLVVGARIIFS